MIITGIDRALMQRAARLIEGQAAQLETVYGLNWAADQTTRQAKLEHDRLRRDARDMRALVKRLQRGAQLEPAAPTLGASLDVGRGETGIE